MVTMQTEQNAAVEKEDALLKRIPTAHLSDLMIMWAARDCEIWHQSPQLYRQLTKRVLAQGEPLLAYDVVAEALNFWPKDVALRQMQGLALSRSGATERANAVLQELSREGSTDEETLGMLGRTYKDLAARAKSPERETLLKRAAEIYGEAYEKTGGYWTGINAATMNLLIGEEGRACAVSQKVRKQCLTKLQNSDGDAYWEYAALG